ncbi:G patch domain-containing protein 11-like isoform X2 [Uloborus diversus]|nr:G patch domain-containing protein 11-like isoform X2 [Uloborus diversus]
MSLIPGKAIKVTDHTKICSKHFSPEFFDREKFGGTWLKKDAVPTIFNIPKTGRTGKIEREVLVRETPELLSNNKADERKHYLGDFKECDMESPTKAKKFFTIATLHEKKRARMIRTLKQKSKRLQERVCSLEESLKTMQKKALVITQSASDIQDIEASDIEMSDDDDDYMSSAFLNVTEDIRPGLTFTKSAKRKHEIEKKRVESNKLHRTKSRKQIEEENRNIGLDSALNSDNKGFALLQKMGYKPGMKLGPENKSNPNAGLIEPIKVEVKEGRGGLGRESEIRKRIERREERKVKMKVYKEKETEKLTEEFRERMRSKVMYKNLMGDLKRGQKVCEQLDTESGIQEPMRAWFWFTQEKDDDEEEYEDEEEEEEEIDAEEQLEFILDYLRSKYFYCLWCGIKYDSEDDISSNCPGVEKVDHDE